ncbi:MAG: exodeoxyribonuclease VII small subunit [Lachnospiraceae bacterium]|nr:exodeoxyribonuclease VII small subunit [Lachnospiraceae bacterium]
MTREEMENMSVEDAFQKIDLMINELSGDIPLEKSFELYKDGIELLKCCNEKIERVEQQIMIINEEGDLDEFQ